MNSRRLAQKWPFPRHKAFERQLRQAASNWFEEKQFAIHPRMSYCLKEWHDWENNIILDEVSNYLEEVKRDSEIPSSSLDTPTSKLPCGILAMTKMIRERRQITFATNHTSEIRDFNL